MERTIKLPAEPLWVNSSLHTGEYWVKPHVHEAYYHLLYVKAGACQITINNQAYEMKPNMVFIAAPNDCHSLMSSASIGLQNSEIKFAVYSETLIKSLSALPKVFEADENQSHLLDLIINSGYDTSGYGNANIAQFSLLSYLYYICDTLRHRELNDCPSHYLQGLDLNGFSRATIDTVLFMEQHYMEEITLEIIGEVIGYNKNYISTMVMKDLSIHANEVLSFIRIQKAAELLHRSDYSVQEICRQAGFKNGSHFARLFKKMVGLTPLQYRFSYPKDILPPEEDILYDSNVPIWGNKLLRDYIELKSN